MAEARPKRIGEQLIDAGLINESQLLRALERQRTWGGRLGSNLVMIGAIKESDLLRFLASKTRVRELDIADIEISPQIIKKIPRKVVEQFHLMPVYMKDKKTLVVALADPTDLNAIDQVQFITGLEVEPVITSYSSILQAIHKYYLGQDLRSSDRQEIVVEEGETRFEADDMRRHGGRPASSDPDLIIFGNQSGEPVSQSAPERVPQSAEEDVGRPLFDFEKPAGEPEFLSAPPTPTAVPNNADLEKFTDAQKLIGLYHVLLKKRLVTEGEIAQELTRLWSLGKLK